MTHLLRLCFKETAFLSSIVKYSMNPGTAKHPRYNMSNSQHAMCEFIYRSPWFSKKHSGLAMWIGYMCVTQQASFHITSFKRHKSPKTKCYTRKEKNLQASLWCWKWYVYTIRLFIGPKDNHNDSIFGKSFDPTDGHVCTLVQTGCLQYMNSFKIFVLGLVSFSSRE